MNLFLAQIIITYSRLLTLTAQTSELSFCGRECLSSGNAISDLHCSVAQGLNFHTIFKALSLILAL